MRPKIAISIGDPNGIGLEIAIKAHDTIKQICQPLYCVDEALIAQAAKLLNTPLPKDMDLFGLDLTCPITPGEITQEAGRYSYESFLKAIELAQENKVDAITTLPIHKKAWEKAGISYKWHTDMLRDIFKRDAIMMLGCSQMYVALFSEHIPLREVIPTIEEKRLTSFLLDFYTSTKASKVAVLGVNPHAGDGGVLGNEESIIKKAISNANSTLQKNIFEGPLVPDVAFTPHIRTHYTYYVAMYHDQGLAPLKALFFDESINVSLNLPILRTSVDHGTAFDIAYKNKAKLQSYLEAIHYILS